MRRMWTGNDQFNKYVYDVYFSGRVANKEKWRAEQLPGCISNCPERNRRCSSFPPNKPFFFLLLFEAWIPIKHTHAPLPFSLSLHASLPCPPTPLTRLLSAPPPLFFLAHVFFSFFFFTIMESPLSTCDSLFHQPKPDRKRKRKKWNACVLLSDSVSLSVGEAEFLYGALVTAIGLSLSVKLFTIETCVSLVT